MIIVITLGEAKNESIISLFLTIFGVISAVVFAGDDAVIIISPDRLGLGWMLCMYYLRGQLFAVGGRWIQNVMQQRWRPIAFDRSG